MKKLREEKRKSIGSPIVKIFEAEAETTSRDSRRHDMYGDKGDANINLPSPPKIVVDLARQIDQKKHR